MRRKIIWTLLALVLLPAAFAGWLILNARAMPVVRRAEVVLPFPADAPRRAMTWEFKIISGAFAAAVVGFVVWLVAF